MILLRIFPVFADSSPISSATMMHLLRILFADSARVILVPEIRSFRYPEDNKYRGVKARFMIERTYDTHEYRHSFDRSFVRQGCRRASRCIASRERA